MHKLILLSILSLLFIKCEKDNLKLKYTTCYIIGFDTCTIQRDVENSVASKEFLAFQQNIKL